MMRTHNRISRWSTRGVTLIILALLVYLFWGEQGWFDWVRQRREYEALRQLTITAGQKNEQLSHQIDRLKKDWDYIESIARNELGMVGKDEIILRMNRPYRDEKENSP